MYNKSQYKWSQFVFQVNSGNDIILYNTYNGSIIVLNKEIHESISNGSVFLEEVNGLIEQGMLIDRKYDEEHEYLETLKDDIDNDSLLNLVIAPTFSCNFSCAYCFESGIESHSFQEKDIIIIESYLQKYLKIHRKINQASISVFGGEPTVAWNFVEKCIPKIINIFKREGITYYVRITSNGYLLSDEKCRFLSKFNWKSAEITIDGPQLIHNKRRMLKNGDGSFSVIMKNLLNILDHRYLDHIDLRINIDRENYQHIPEFLKELSLYYSPDNFQISLGRLTDTVSSTNAHKHNAPILLDSGSWEDVFLELYKQLEKFGFSTPEFYSLDGYCLAKEKYGLIICPDKNIYRCLSMVGREEYADDYLYNPCFQPKALLDFDIIKKCLSEKCPFVPNCLGGCYFEGMLKTGKKVARHCRRNEYSRINAEIIREKYGKD